MLIHAGFRGRLFFSSSHWGRVLGHTYPCTHYKWQLWKVRASEHETHLGTSQKWGAGKNLPTGRGRTPLLSKSIWDLQRSPLYFLATLVNIVRHPIPKIFTMLISEYSIQLKIRLLNCSFSTQRAAKLWLSVAKCACISTTPGMSMNHLFPLLWLLFSEALFSEFVGFGVHWNSTVNTQLGDLIYENSFKPFTTLTNPVQVHWANSKVALSLFIGFQLH